MRASSRVGRRDRPMRDDDTVNGSRRLLFRALSNERVTLLEDLDGGALDRVGQVPRIRRPVHPHTATYRHDQCP